MTAQLIIGNKNYSSWSLRAWLVLAKLELPFEEVLVPLSVETSKAALYRYSPSGRVPVYRDGDLTIWDTLAIAEYLAESHPQLWPQEAGQRAHARAVSAEMHAGFMALRQQMPMNCRATGRQVPVPPALATDIQRVQEIWTTCRRTSGDAGPWLFGDFSIADAMYAPVVFRFNTYGEASGIDHSDAVTAYMAHVIADPHIQQWYAAACQETAVIEEEEVGR
ncbi:MAG: glutathione S-transferase family protein [Cyanobacteria bacterium P01_A01_bin.135]